jgi:hypothetical protein
MRNAAPFAALALLAASSWGLLSACNQTGFKTSAAKSNPDRTPSDQTTGPSLDQAQNRPVTQDIGGGVVSQNTPEQSDSRNDYINNLLDLAATLMSKQGTNTNTANPLADEPQSSQRPTCSDSTTSQRPVDIVFSIDVSSSMDPYIAVVRDNVIAFVAALGQQGLDARVGAVGFVNAPAVSIEPTDVVDFQRVIATWRTINDRSNKEMQEGGQLGMEHALFLLSSGGRQGAHKVVLHISDALAFAGNDPFDFSTDRLASVFRAAASQFGSLQLFDSVPAAKGTTGDPMRQLQTVFSPQDQLRDLRSQAGISAGRSLPFPFAASALTLELPQDIGQQIASRCR